VPPPLFFSVLTSDAAFNSSCRHVCFPQSPQDNGAPVADRLYAGGSTFSEVRESYVDAHWYV
jgi:hypothetical protein